MSGKGRQSYKTYPANLVYSLREAFQLIYTLSAREKMRRQKLDGASGGFGGDWSQSGTFLRKPASGWLHEESELMDNSCINYEVEYLGSIEVSQSMRTLQFNVRTQVTKEAILRLAEGAGKVYVGKKRKVPKQINKLLGAADTRLAGFLNLSVSVEDLKISDPGNSVLLKHSLPSISFASGGDGPTVDFIGYVAKDPVHRRACHVFECRDSSQYVLTTIGQAFELRYKLYLKTPRPNVHPVGVNDSWGNDAWGTSRHQAAESHSYTTSAEVHTPLSPKSPETPPPLPPPLNTNIYDDVPQTPPSVPESRPRVYSNLPGFPLEDEDVCVNSRAADHAHSGVPRLENPYDTMNIETSPPSQRQSMFSKQGVYSDPGEVTGSRDRTYSDPNYEDYSSRQLMTIRQIPTSGPSGLNDDIDLTPAPPINDYSNVGPNGEVLDEPVRKKPPPPKKPPRPPEMLNGSDLYDDADSLPIARPVPASRATKKVGRVSSPEDLYGNREVERALDLKHGREMVDNDNVYEDAEALDKMIAPPPVKSYTPAGTYDNPDEIIGSLGGGRDNVYDIAETNELDVYDDIAASKAQTPISPKFDDAIYMKQGETPSPTPLQKPTPMKRPPTTRKPAAFKNMKSLSQALPDPPAPLPRQQYYHGSISRVESEALLEKDGQFLIRESSKRPGQYVLTGMANGHPQHLLLMDKEGRVKSKDHEFESIPHLVAYFVEKKVPLIIGGSQVFLKDSIISISSYRH